MICYLYCYFLLDLQYNPVKSDSQRTEKIGSNFDLSQTILSDLTGILEKKVTKNNTRITQFFFNFS